jgi:hypothetical protein
MLSDRWTDVGETPEGAMMLTLLLLLLMDSIPGKSSSSPVGKGNLVPVPVLAGARSLVWLLFTDTDLRLSLEKAFRGRILEMVS